MLRFALGGHVGTAIAATVIAYISGKQDQTPRPVPGEVPGQVAE